MSVTINRAAVGLDPQAAPEPLAETCFSQPQVLDLCAYRGDSGRFRVTVTESDGTTPIDISAATWDCDIRLSADDATSAGSMDVEPVVGTPNAVDVILTASVSASLDDPAYVWDLEMTLGTEVTTLLAGRLTVTKDVSRAT